MIVGLSFCSFVPLSLVFQHREEVRAARAREKARQQQEFGWDDHATHDDHVKDKQKDMDQADIEGLKGADEEKEQAAATEGGGPRLGLNAKKQKAQEEHEQAVARALQEVG